LTSCEYPRVGALVTGRLHPDPADARSPLLRAFRLSGGLIAAIGGAVILRT